MSEAAVRYLFSRIPALADLRGAQRLDAEELIHNAVADAIDDYLADCEPSADPAAIAAALNGGPPGRVLP